MTKTLYVVQYNDCYGNGDKKLEVIVESHEDFKNWLKIHNEERKLDYLTNDDFVEEHEEEFDLIPLNLFK
jgi:hypothetical protein